MSHDKHEGDDNCDEDNTDYVWMVLVSTYSQVSALGPNLGDPTNPQYIVSLWLTNATTTYATKQSIAAPTVATWTTTLAIVSL